MEELFSANGWKVVRDEASLPDGRIKRSMRLLRPDVVQILAFADRENILALREYRPFYNDWIWGLPAGKMDRVTEQREEAAQRELREETGYRAKRLKYLWSARFIQSIGMNSHFFFARDLVEDPLPQDEYELIEVHHLPPERALELVLGSSEVNIGSAYLLLRYLREQETVQWE